MEAGAVIMLIFGCTLLFGGLGFFISNAIRSEKKKSMNVTIGK